MDGREGEEDVFAIIKDSTLLVGPNDGGDQDDGSQYLNDSGQGIEEEEQLQGSVKAGALVKAGEPTASKMTSTSTSSTKTTPPPNTSNLAPGSRPDDAVPVRSTSNLRVVLSSRLDRDRKSVV